MCQTQCRNIWEKNVIPFSFHFLYHFPHLICFWYSNFNLHTFYNWFQLNICIAINSKLQFRLFTISNLFQFRVCNEFSSIKTTKMTKTLVGINDGRTPVGRYRFVNGFWITHLTPKAHPFVFPFHQRCESNRQQTSLRVHCTPNWRRVHLSAIIVLEYNFNLVMMDSFSKYPDSFPEDMHN